MAELTVRMLNINHGIDDCIEKGVLKEFLLKNRMEVLGMLLEEFDAEKYAVSENEAEQELQLYWKQEIGE